jgi:hypothetical protein
MAQRHNAGKPEGYEGFANRAKPSSAVVMRIFDDLPPDVRGAVSAANLDWNVEMIRDRISEGVMTALDVVRFIGEFEAHVKANVEKSRYG